MALKDFFALVDDKLHDIFERSEPDPAKARKPFLRAIDKAVKQFEEGKQPRGANRFWSANNNVVKLTPNVGGRGINIGGKSAQTIPAERFPDAMKALKAAVEKGELDDVLNADADSTVTKPKAERKTRGPLSPEALAARRAKVAAKTAAQG
jgi:hypothetical protein